MWMVLHVDGAVYTEYDQLRHVHVSVVDSRQRKLLRKREILALAAEGLVNGIKTDRSTPITVEFLSQVCRDHAPAIYDRYVAGTAGCLRLGGNVDEIEVDGLLSEIRFRIVEQRTDRIMA